MSEISKNIWYYNIFNNRYFVLGICLVHRDFDAKYHRHIEPERYVFMLGKGALYLCDDLKEKSTKQEKKICGAFHIEDIKGNVWHYMKPITRYVLLFYYFSTGPFDTIEYIHEPKENKAE